MRQRICPVCDAAFVPRYGGQVCCSDECKLNRLRMQRRGSKRRNARIRKLSPRQQMFVNLRQRDAIAPKPKTEVICRDGIVIERRGTVPAGCRAVGIIRHNA